MKVTANRANLANDCEQPLETYAVTCFGEKPILAMLTLNNQNNKTTWTGSTQMKRMKSQP
jgi:hypothetical protein